MFEYIKGILTEISPIKVTLETAGVGYGLLIPLSTYSKLPQIGKETLLYVSHIIREDSHKLYGFIHRQDRDLFEKFTDVSGIGPKTSLALLGHLDIQDLQLAITSTNTTLLCKIPGIGKKTAERLIIEMKDKILQMSTSKEKIQTLDKKEPNHLFNDALNALINLGYHPLQSQKAVKTVLESHKNEIDLGTLITSALRSM
ncbi:MAG: Holliday junction branch migration protein RuvA [Chlamydiae bacterium]|jgi:Holliday junction DNA helicase RuvA|nr:Holliday junction branch migration protein RuvA [Chlamydiota bacterium]